MDSQRSQKKPSSSSTERVAHWMKGNRDVALAFSGNRRAQHKSDHLKQRWPVLVVEKGKRFDKKPAFIKNAEGLIWFGQYQGRCAQPHSVNKCHVFRISASPIINTNNDKNRRMNTVRVCCFVIIESS